MDLISMVVSEGSPWLGHKSILSVLQAASALYQPHNLSVLPAATMYPRLTLRPQSCLRNTQATLKSSLPEISRWTQISLGSTSCLSYPPWDTSMFPPCFVASSFAWVFYCHHHPSPFHSVQPATFVSMHDPQLLHCLWLHWWPTDCLGSFNNFLENASHCLRVLLRYFGVPWLAQHAIVYLDVTPCLPWCSISPNFQFHPSCLSVPPPRDCVSLDVWVKPQMPMYLPWMSQCTPHTSMWLPCSPTGCLEVYLAGSALHAPLMFPCSLSVTKLPCCLPQIFGIPQAVSVFSQILSSFWWLGVPMTVCISLRLPQCPFFLLSCTQSCINVFP